MEFLKHNHIIMNIISILSMEVYHLFFKYLLNKLKLLPLIKINLLKIHYYEVNY